MRLDNNRGFFSLEQQSCRILTRLASLFCVHEAGAVRAGGAALGDGQRERSAPAEHSRLVVTKHQLSSLPLARMLLAVAGKVPPGSAHHGDPCHTDVVLQLHGEPSLRASPSLPPSRGCSSSASARSGNSGLRQGHYAHVL